MRLVDTDGAEVKLGSKLTNSRGETAWLQSGRPPHKPGSSGHISVVRKRSQLGDALACGPEYYPSVFGLKWVADEGVEPTS